MSNVEVKKRCFVVMGFGRKPDLATSRIIDLNKSYEYLIKPVVEAKGLVCVRADEIAHSGVIDVPMYQELLTADLVIADISTANSNAIYELGIRHALRPFTTIVMSESELKYPFDLNHILITSYSYMSGGGSDGSGGIDFNEVMRFREVLGGKIDEVMRNPRTDSPVYTYLNELQPPALAKKVVAAVEKAGLALKAAGEKIAEAESRSPTPPASGPTLSELIEQGEQAIRSDDFATAKERFGHALELFKARQNDSDREDAYLIQRLALATYKAKQPDGVTALNDALGVLAPLKPSESNDPETVGLAGAIEKRLFENGQGVEHLARAIKCYARGYTLRDDYYNGINLAYLLSVRTDTSLDATDPERIADLVVANRIRREVLIVCNRELESIQNRREQMASHPPTVPDAEPQPTAGSALTSRQLDDRSMARSVLAQLSDEQKFADWCSPSGASQLRPRPTSAWAKPTITRRPASSCWPWPPRPPCGWSNPSTARS